MAQLGKPQRQHRIARLLEEQVVSSQPQVVDLLAAEGVHATQATVSRDLEELGAVPVPARVVEHDKIVTAAGVSSGIDMALGLVQRINGDEVAQAVQLGIEYDPEPPLDAGSPEKAPEPIVELVTAAFAAQQDRAAGEHA